MKYKLRYVDGNYSDSGTLPTYIGSILHKGLELKALSKMNGDPVDYKYIKKIVNDGWNEKTEKDKEEIIGLDAIMLLFFSDWLNDGYNEKIELFFNDVLPERMEDMSWNIIGAEVHFEFVYDDRCIIHGFIDRIDEKDGNLKVVDYKSSKKIFPDTKIKTPLQMVIYDLACLYMFEILPDQHEYDFILLNQRQTTADGVCSKGYLKRGIKKLDCLLDQIDRLQIDGEYIPCPTPLCYWCSFADLDHTPNADPKYAGLCPYYSLWTPDDRKNFAVNQKYEGEIF